LYFVDIENNRLFIEEIQGISLKQFLFDNQNRFSELLDVAAAIGIIISKLHDAEIIHGDLTTSNFLIRNSISSISSTSSSSSTSTSTSSASATTLSSNIPASSTFPLVVIDFGLSYGSSLAEDRAVDLYVLERAFLSTHPNSEVLFNEVLNSYLKHCSKCSESFNKLKKVRSRGRKKLAFG